MLNFLVVRLFEEANQRGYFNQAVRVGGWIMWNKFPRKGDRLSEDVDVFLIFNYVYTIDRNDHHRKNKNKTLQSALFWRLKAMHNINDSIHQQIQFVIQNLQTLNHRLINKYLKTNIRIYLVGIGDAEPSLKIETLHQSASILTLHHRWKQFSEITN